MLRAGPDPLSIMLVYAHAGPNHTGRGPAHLPQVKFSGLVERVGEELVRWVRMEVEDPFGKEGRNVGARVTGGADAIARPVTG
jgi:hypothetical protein